MWTFTSPLTALYLQIHYHHVLGMVFLAGEELVGQGSVPVTRPAAAAGAALPKGAVIDVPAQLLRTGRRLVFRFLAWKPQLPVFFRLLDGL